MPLATCIRRLTYVCGRKLPLDVSEKRLLSRRYLHQSAHWTIDAWTPEYKAPTTPGAPTVAILPRPPAGPALMFPMRPGPWRERLAYTQRRGH